MAVGAPSLIASPLEPQRSYRFLRGRGGRWSYQVHAHTTYEIIGMECGHGVAMVGDSSGTFKAGDCFAIAPGVPHSFYTDGFLPNGELVGMSLAWFQPQLVSAERVGEFAALAPMLARTRRGLQLSGPHATEAIRHLGAGTTRTEPMEAYSDLLRLLATLAASLEVAKPLAEHETSSSFRAGEMARLDGIMRILRERFHQPLTLEGVAHEAGVSASSVNMLLRKYSRTTFLAALTRLRLEQARHLLRETRGEIAQIGQQSGFGSLATFHRRFRAVERMSPHEYREIHS